MLPLRGSFLSTNLQTLQPLCNPQQKFDNLSRCGTNATVFFEGVAFFASKGTRSVSGGVAELSVVGCYLLAQINWTCLMNVFENKFSAIISQIQQSPIATTSFHSTQTCGGRSSLVAQSSIYLSNNLILTPIKMQKFRIFALWLN